MDVSILSALQDDGKLSMQGLAAKVGSSASHCWRRIRAFEKAGIIRGYGARLSAAELGLGAVAYVHVALNNHQTESLEAFQKMVAREDQIVECATITGEHDFVLKVYARRPEDLEAFIMKTIVKSGLVRATSSHLVLHQSKTGGKLPVLACEGAA